MTDQDKTLVPAVAAMVNYKADLQTFETGLKSSLSSTVFRQRMSRFPSPNV
jgi:hypothetical protein